MNIWHPLRSVSSLRFSQMVTRPILFALLATPLITACGSERSPTAPPPPPALSPPGPLLFSLNGTWTANGPGLINYSFTFHEETNGAITGSWSGTRIDCVGAGCSVSGLVTSSIRTGNQVQLQLVDEANYFGVLLSGSVYEKTLTGGIALYWSNPQLPGWLFMGDADYFAPVTLSR